MRIYFFPFLMDLTVFAVLMRVVDASGRTLGFSDGQAAWLMTGFTLAYLVGSLAIGHFLTRTNARRSLLLSTGACMLLGSAVFFAQDYWLIMAELVGFGLASAGFFNSFQTFMRGESPPGSLLQVTARYTLSWSMGIGCGYLLSGVLVQFDQPWLLAGCTSAACLTVAVLTLTYRPLGDTDSADGHVDHSGDPVRAGRYVWIGWGLILVANICVAPIRTFVPKALAELGSPAWLGGLMLFTLFVVQALVGYAVQYRRGLFYKAAPVLIGQGILVAGLACIVFVPGTAGLFALCVLVGSVSGFVYTASVYYAANGANSSRNIGVNESLVAVGGIAGMLLPAWGMYLSGRKDAWGLVSAGLIVLVILVQAWWLQRGGAAPATDDASLAPETPAP